MSIFILLVITYLNVSYEIFRYPSCYVLVTDLDDNANQHQSPVNLNIPPTGSASTTDRYVLSIITKFIN